MGIKQRSKSLLSRKSALSDGMYQLRVINRPSEDNGSFDSFESRLKSHNRLPLKPAGIQILQLNLGKLCNQSCAHCHVDAGPDRKEVMTKETLELCLEVLRTSDIQTVDLTGGAPEMNPNFRWFVESCTALGKTVLNRCNLTIIESNPKYHDLPEFFAANNVHLISSLPYFSKSRTDRQRGEGVFEDSIAALKKLNQAGYGQFNSKLTLDLVYNPSGAFLPASQISLEKEFKSQLDRKFGIHFNALYCITNLPISRFLDYLIGSGNYNQYMETLIQAFNPSTIDGLMCRSMISVGWDGFMYDCDFNQMLDLKVSSKRQHIADFDLDELNNRKIVLNQHCYGCTAGAGSSCGGEIA
jgi:radical SAM/Cys-rich protein